MDEKHERIDLDSGSLEKGGALDDLSISGEAIDLLRLERMGDGTFWGRIYMNEGPDLVLGFYVKGRKLIADIRHD